MPEKNPNVNSSLKNLTMLPSYFDYIFVHLRQKARLRPESSRKFIQHFARTRPEKPGPTYNCGVNAPQHLQYNPLKLPLWSLVYRGLPNSKVTLVQSGRNHSSVYLLSGLYIYYIHWSIYIYYIYSSTIRSES